MRARGTRKEPQPCQLLSYYFSISLRFCIHIGQLFASVQLICPQPSLGRDSTWCMLAVPGQLGVALSQQTAMAPTKFWKPHSHHLLLWQKLKGRSFLGNWGIWGKSSDFSPFFMFICLEVDFELNYFSN